MTEKPDEKTLTLLMAIWNLLNPGKTIGVSTAIDAYERAAKKVREHRVAGG